MPAISFSFDATLNLIDYLKCQIQMTKHGLSTRLNFCNLYISVPRYFKFLLFSNVMETLPLSQAVEARSLSFSPPLFSPSLSVCTAPVSLALASLLLFFVALLLHFVDL